MAFSRVYPQLVAKAERKGRSKGEVDAALFWLSGYDPAGLARQLHPNRGLIRGVVCGVRVEEITDPPMQQIRWLDKLVDELSKGKPLEKVLRMTPRCDA